MCYSDDAHPPFPPVIAGGAADAAELTLRSADGTEFDAYHARTSQPSGAAIVILPDVRGLHDFYKELAQRFAEAGVHAIAIDYFARSAGQGTARDESFEYRPHVEQAKAEIVDADARVAIEYMRSPDGGGAERVYTVGFCWGGSNSWRQSATQEGLAGAIGFYGIPSRVQDYAERMRTPLLIFAAGQDFTPVEDTERFAESVRANGVEVELQVYPDAPHSFFDRSFEQHRAECDDAWRRMLAFMGAAV
ncbi:MAG TPA: dienelactone hydrolase family protein [Candidatus Dormibacteraeota bacterium]